MDGEDPFSSPTALRAKRNASSAQLLDLDPQASTSRIRQKAQAFSSHMEIAALERRIIFLESEKKDLESQLTQKDRTVAKLEGDRRWLADREKEEREEKEQEMVEREEEKRQASTSLRTLRIELSTTREEFADLKEAYSSLKHTSSQTTNTQKSHLLELTRQVALFEEELASSQKIADNLRIELDGERQKGKEREIEREKRGDDDKENWQVVREELHRQVSFMRALETANAKLTGEVASLRERHASVEVLKEEKRALERRAATSDELREAVGRLEAEVEAGRKERELWAREVRAEREGEDERTTPSKAPAVGVSKALASLRMSNALLQEEHGATAAALKRREAELADAGCREAMLQEQLAKVKEDMKEMQAQATRKERRLELAEREVGFLKALAASYAAERSAAAQAGSEEEDDAKMKRIQHLEEIVESLKEENTSLEKEVDARGSRHDVSWEDLMRTAEKERTQRKQLELDIAEVEAINQKGLLKIDALEQTLFELQGDIATGAHVPPNTRVLSMRENPLQNWTDLRQEVMDRLKKENKALLKRLDDLEESGAGGGQGVEAKENIHHLVPRESWEKEQKEKCELEEVVKQKEKRMLRLQQVYNTKAQEFREVMSSILGFKFHFFANGQVKVTSQYDLNTSFVFQPIRNQETDDDGTRMQLVSEGDSSLPDLARTVDYWVKQRMCIPGLMATVTLECYDKTKRGQAQAWAVSK